MPRDHSYFWGYKSEKGEDAAVGYNRNLPLPIGSDDAPYLKAVETACHAIRRFGPRYLIVSAGFDTHANDPIGGFKLSMNVYGEIADLRLPTVICQEGGYNLKTLGRCVASFISGFASAASE